MPRSLIPVTFAATLVAMLEPGCGSEVRPGSPACDGYLDEAPAQDVTVTIRNEGADAIYLGGQGCRPDIELSLGGPDGNGLPQRANGCGFTCEDLQQHGAECAADCALPPVVRVDPGGSYQVSWSGTYVEPASMPEGCFFESGYASYGCQQRIVAPTSDYTLTASAWPQTTCVDNTCECQPDANGSCTLGGFAGVDGPPMQASGVVSYPSETSIDIVFQ